MELTSDSDARDNWNEKDNKLQGLETAELETEPRTISFLTPLCYIALFSLRRAL